MLCAVAACGKPVVHDAARAPDAFLIVPGHAIGPLALGASDEQARATALGPPDRVVRDGDTTALVWLGDVAPGSAGYDRVDPEYAPLHDWIVALVVGGRVVEIEASSSRFHTTDGAITTAKSVTELARAPHVTRDWHVGNRDEGGATPAPKHLIWYDDAAAAGVAIKYGTWGGLSPDPDLDAHPEAIAVHAPNAELVHDPVDALPYGGHAKASFDVVDER